MNIQPSQMVSRILHWAFGLFVLLMLSLGFTMTNTEYSHALYFWHKSLGVVFLLLIGLRVYWSLRHPWPSSASPSGLQWLVRCVHGALLFFLMAMPITGFLSSAFSGYGAHFFGIVIVPENVNALGETEAFSAVTYESAKWLHRVMAYTFTLLIAVHILAALKHHFVDRDNTLRKMLGREDG